MGFSDWLAKNVPGYWRMSTFLGRGNPSSQQWLRVVMDQSVRAMVEKLDLKNRRVLEISGNSWQWLADRADYRSVSFPEFDICQGPLNESFDLIIAEQVFEHLTYPLRAARNVHAMLNPGGRFLITTPFLFKIHYAPIDCSRWSPQGMKYFLEEAGFPLAHIEVDSWGNYDCALANLKSNAAVKYVAGRHSLENQEYFPMEVWAMAQKPREALDHPKSVCSS